MVQMSGSSYPRVHGASGGSDKPPNQGSHQDLQEKLRRRFQRRALSRASNSSGSQNTSPAPRLEEGNGRQGATRVHAPELRRPGRVDGNVTPDMLLNDPDGNGNFMFFDGEQKSPKPSRSFKGFGKGQGHNASPKVVKSDPIDSALNAVLGEMQNDKSQKKNTPSVESGPVFQNNFDDEEITPSECLPAQARLPARLQRVQPGHHKPPSRVPFWMEDDGDGDDEDTETDDPPIRRGQGYAQGQAQNVDPIKEMMDSLMGKNGEQGMNANNDPIVALMGEPRHAMNGGGHDNGNPFADMFGENVDNSFDSFFQNMRNSGHNALMNAQQSQNQLLGQQIGQQNGQSNNSADDIVDRLYADSMPGAENGFGNVGQDKNPEADEGFRELLLGSGERRVRRRHRGWESLWDPEDNPVISDGEVENPADDLLSSLLSFGRNDDNERGQIPFAGEDNGGEEGGNKIVPRNSGGPIGNPNRMGELGRNPLHALLGGSNESSNDSNDLVQQTLQTMLGGLGGNGQLRPDDMLSLMGPGQSRSGQSVDLMSPNLREGGSNNGLMEGAGLMRPDFMREGEMGLGMRGANAMVPAQMGAGRMGQGVMAGDDIDPDNHSDTDILIQLLELERMRAEQNKAPRADQALHTIIVLDVSGSMDGEPFVEAGKFITEFINGLEEIQFEYNQQENVALICVGESVQVVQHFTNNYSLIERAANTLLTGGPSKLSMGLTLPEVLLNHGSYDNRPGMGGVYQVGSHTAQPRLILLSDGYPTLTSDEPGSVPDDKTTLALQSGCLNLVQTCAQNTLMKVFCVPVGHNVSLNFLEILSQSTGGRVVHPSEAKYLSRSVLHHVLVAKLKEASAEEPDRSTVVRILKQVTAAADEVDVNGVFEVYRDGEPDLQLRDQLVLSKLRESGSMLPEGKDAAMMMGKGMGIMPSRGQGMSAPSGVDLAGMLSRGQGMPASSGLDLAGMFNRGQGMSATSGVDLAGMLNRGQGMSAPSGLDLAGMSNRGQGMPTSSGLDIAGVPSRGQGMPTPSGLDLAGMSSRGQGMPAPSGLDLVGMSSRGQGMRAPTGLDHASIANRGSSLLGDQGGQGGQAVPKLGGMPPALADLMGLSGQQNLDGLKESSSLKENNQETGIDALFGNVKRNGERQRRESDFDAMFSGFNRDQAMNGSDNNQFGLDESMFQSSSGPLEASAGRQNFSESTLRGQLPGRGLSQRQAQDDINGINQQEVNDDFIKQMSAMLTSPKNRERTSMVDSRSEMDGGSSLGPVIPNRRQPVQRSMQQFSRQNEVNEPSQVGQGSVFRRINPPNAQGGADMAGYGGGHRMLNGLHQQSRQRGQNNGSGRNSRQSHGQFFNSMPPRKDNSNNP